MNKKVREKVNKDWYDFQKNLKENNRFFIDNEFQQKLENVIQRHSIHLNSGTDLYRARINYSLPLEKPIPIEKMGAPPKDNAKANRASPIGISYLYTSLDEKICVSEVRPSIGQFVTIAKFMVRKKLLIASFYDAFAGVSDEYVDYLAMNINATFSRPIIFGESEIEYLPFQFISELIKRLDYDGIQYSSNFKTSISERNQTNLVLFDENLVKPVAETKAVKIIKSNLDYIEL